MIRRVRFENAFSKSAVTYHRYDLHSGTKMSYLVITHFPEVKFLGSKNRIAMHDAVVAQVTET